MSAGNINRRSELKRQVKDLEVQIDRLPTAVAEATIPDSFLLREKLSSLHARWVECIRLLGLLDVDAPPLRQTLSKQQAAAEASKLRRKLLDATPQLQRLYIRGPVSEIVLTTNGQ